MQMQAAVDNADKPLHPKSEQSLLGMVLGMAVAKYRYKPGTAYSGVAARIERDLKANGIDLGDDTIRKWLQKAGDEHGHLLNDLVRS